MIKTRSIYTTIWGLLRRLLIVNFIGFFIGAISNGRMVLDYWAEYFLYSTIIGMSLWLGNEAFSKFIDTKMSWLKYPFRKLMLRIVFSLVYSTLVLVVIYLTIWFRVQHHTSLEGFLRHNRISFVIFYACTVIILLVYHSITFFKAWQATALNEERLKKESIAFQLQALRNQLDPHFLFNSLNTLTSLIEVDSAKAITFVKRLSDMFRYMLDRNSSELIDIRSELKFVEAYIYLQQMRYGDNLKVEIEVKDQTFYVLPVSLQLLIENAIKHNEISGEFPLLVRMYDVDDFVVVCNRLQPKISGSSSGGIGLQNLKERYRFFTDKEVTINSAAGEFVVKLPKLSIS
jgi:sensor histidine kinase YesM